jgi:protein involved in polysaccharide export with SLBB domain
MLSVRRERSDPLPLLGAAGSLIAVGCCAGLPAIATIHAGLTVAAVIGVAGGVLLAAGALSGDALMWRARHRRRAAEAPERGIRQ